MICPKCQFEQPESNAECRNCGVIFAKLTSEDWEMPPDPIDRKKKNLHQDRASAGMISSYLLDDEKVEGSFVVAGRALIYLIFFIWGWNLIITTGYDYSGQTFLHGVSLAFHEAGHVIFWGNQITVALAGSIMQILMPAVFVAAFIYHRNPFGASVALWWVAQNFMDIAPYINDARALSLTLLGGITGEDDPEGHDWHFILRELGWLRHDHTIAKLAFFAGVILMIVSFIWGGYILWRQFKALRSYKPVV
jgi:hypothetical protein